MLEVETVQADPSARAPEFTQVPPLELEEDEEEAEEPDAWYSVRTGAMVVTGVPQEEDGSFILPAELVADIRRQLAWGPLR